MRNLATVLLVSALLVLGPAPSALAFGLQSGTRVVVAPGETVTDDLIVSGVTISIEGTVTGDVIAFAESVTVTGTIEGNLVAMGSAVDVRGRVDGSVYVVADDLLVAGQVGNSVVSLASGATIDREGELGGNWIGFGNRLRAEGSIGRGVLAFARNLRLDGPVAGDVEVWPGRLTLGESAAIEGSVTYHSAQEAVIESGARVGALNFVPREAGGEDITSSHMMRLGVRFGGFLVVGLVLLSLVPGMRTRFPRILARRSWQAPLLGLAVMVAAPVAVILLLITVVGVQPALLTLLLYPVALYAGQVLLSWTVGRLVADRWAWLDRQHWAIIFLAGALATTLLTELPYVGFTVKIVAMGYGLGGLLYALADRGGGEVAV